MRIAAVVVTRDRLTLLQRCVEALRQQTRRLDEILVVDNASSDGTREWVDTQDVTRLFQENVGGGGGQAAGIGEAVRRGHDWVWCMDDDGYPAPDALQRLVEIAQDAQADWANCLVVRTDDPCTLLHYWAPGGTQLTRVDQLSRLGVWVPGGHPFNGTLLHRSLVARIGVPSATLFIKGDEREYKRRAEAHGARIVTATRSLFFHPPSAGTILDVPLGASWRFYYAVRNEDARVEPDGRVRFSASGAIRVGRALIRLLVLDCARNCLKGLVVLHGVWAACVNDQRRRYRRD